MKFKDYQYTRPDVLAIEQEIKQLLEQFENAKNKEDQIVVIDRMNQIRSDFDTMQVLVSIRNSINTKDEFYEKENDFFDEQKPVFDGWIDGYQKLLVKSKFKADLVKQYGKYLFEKVELQLKTFSQEIIDLLIQENKLTSKYDRLMASAKIDFEGEIRNLSQMGPFTQSKNRGTREKAQLAIAGFLEENETEIDTIYDDLVKVRTEMAHKLGYENYVDLGYARLGRTDYDKHMVANYRKQVNDSLVPLSQELLERQRQRLGLNNLRYFDLNLKFLSGNATPIGDKDYLVNEAKKMYSQMSKETEEFFNFMIEHDLLDLEAKEGKMGGGYCTFISNYQSPFIFSNFNGTSADVDVLTHEAGHAFQVFQSRQIPVPEYIWPTYEACEIHSMSMEFFAWPWMHSFFGEEEMKYKYSHLADALLFVPYGVTVDEFQHYVYENPQATPEMRKTAWREIEKKYLPHKQYEGNSFFERGGYWFRQGHIFSSPFYYIDYTLAQICAFQYLILSFKDRQSAWNNYVALCKLGGSRPFLELVEAAGLDNPFVDGTVSKITSEVTKILDSINDQEL